MVFNFDNQTALEDIYFHDSFFEGFTYDYDQRQMRFDLRHEWNGKLRHLCFRNVVALELQGCAFWCPSNSVYHLWIDENPDYFHCYEERHRQDPYKTSLLDDGIRFISVMMQINSGDELRLTCESVEVTEEDLAK